MSTNDTDPGLNPNLKPSKEPNLKLVAGVLTAIVVIGTATAFTMSSKEKATPETPPTEIANDFCPALPSLPNNQESSEVKGSVDLVKSGKWENMPGISREPGGLRVTPLNRRIVDQDGSGGIENQPINLFGSRLAVDGNFELTFKMTELRADEGSINLYAQPPIVRDEGLIGCQGGVRVAVERNSFWVGPPDSETADYKTKKEIFIEPSESHTIRVRREGGVMTFTINDKQQITINDDLFKTGQVWFGADSETSPYLLPEISVKPLSEGKVRVVDTTTLDVAQDNPDAFQAIIDNARGTKKIGAAVALGPLVGDKMYSELAVEWFGSWTSENAGKMQFTQPRRGVYTLGEMDAIVALAEEDKKATHGHTLVFGEANPLWVRDLAKTNPEQLESVMIDHITTLVSHYKGKVKSWDVVNEPIADYDEFKAGSAELRDHIWHQNMGEGYIDIAFRAAQEADPKALRFINEYGLEGSIGDEDTKRWDAFLGLIVRLQTRGVPIDGVGFQAHMYEEGDKIDREVFSSRIKQLQERKLLFRISEMDGDFARGQYAEVLDICLKAWNCVGVTLWGISNRYNWYDDNGLKQGKDFLWDKDMKPSDDVRAIQEQLNQ